MTENAQLYFAAPTTPEAQPSRALLVSHSFPPDSEVGALRWQQMVRHFAECGWIFDVLTRDFDGVKSLDLARLESLPPGTRVFSVRSAEPFLFRLERRVWPTLRGVVREKSSKTEVNGAKTTRSDGTPARRLGRVIAQAYRAWIIFARDGNWARAAARVGAELAKRENYRVVISSGPPHMAHEGARRIARSAGLPHVVDMRDPWSLVQRLDDEIASPVWKYLAKHFERRVVLDASLIAMNTEPAAAAMRAVYQDQSQKIEVIRNGCDDEQLPQAVRDGRFTVRFAGSIYIDRDPRLLFRAARSVISELGLTPEQFAIEFVGDVDRFGATPTMEIAREEGLEAFVTLRGLVPRGEALAFLGGATVLLSLPQDSDFAIPAKIYEYLRFDAWMLVLAHSSSATACLLEGTDADVLDPADADGMARVLRRRYEQFARGETPRAAGRGGEFARRSQSQKLMGLIERVIQPR